jgi:hypothetical protein
MELGAWGRIGEGENGWGVPLWASLNYLMTHSRSTLICFFNLVFLFIFFVYSLSQADLSLFCIADNHH